MLVTDSGVILRAFNTAHLAHSAARKFLRTFRNDKRLVAFSQVIAEFWVVSTRPTTQNGLGQTIDVTNQRLAFLEQLGEVLCEHEDAYGIWKKLLL